MNNLTLATLAENTYAVVVGIESYQMAPKLDGAAWNALNFAIWLKNNRVPPQNISLFLDELNDNKEKDLSDKSQFTIKEANALNIYQEFYQRLVKKNGSLLYIYWAGHGYTVNVDIYKLLYPEGNAFNLTSLLKHLKTKKFAGFSKQIIVIDACSVHQKSVISDSKAPYEVDEYSRETITGLEQVVLLATKAGGTAKYDKGKGLFTKVLLEELEIPTKILLPEEMKDIKENLPKRLEKEDNKIHQIPICLWFQDKEGNIDRIGLTNGGNTSIILDKQWNSFLEIINVLNGKTISNYCVQFFSQYSDDPQGYYTEDLLKENNYDSLKVTFLDFKPHQNQKYDLPLLLEFANFLAQSPQAELSVIQKRLNEWIIDTTGKLGIDNKLLNQSFEQNKKKYPSIYSTGLPYLLILFEPNISSDANPKFEFNLKAELKFQERLSLQEVTIEKVELTTSKSLGVNLKNNEDIEATYLKIYELIEESNKKLLLYKNINQLTIELFLPRQYFVFFAPEIEELPINEPDPDWFGSKYKLIIRSYDRFNHYEYYHMLLTKWTELSHLVEQDPLTLDTLEKFNEKIICLKKLQQSYNWKKLRQKAAQQLININLNCPLAQKSYNCHIQEFLTSLLRCGIPVSFWLRKNTLENLKLGEIEERESQEEVGEFKFEDILTIENLQVPEKLFESIRNIRENAYVVPENEQQEYLGYHLGFLFDNPYRLHSKFDVQLSEDILVFNQ